MKKFLLAVILPLFLAVLGFLIVGEIVLRSLPGDIKYKSEYMNKNASRIKILVLGPSTTSMGVKPAYFDIQPSFNCAMGAQGIEEDYWILSKYIDQMDSLRVVILDFPAIGVVESTKGANNAQDEVMGVGNTSRTKKYRIYYDCPYYTGIENNFEITSGVSDVIRTILVNSTNKSPDMFLSIDKEDGYQSHYFVEMSDDEQQWRHSAANIINRLNKSKTMTRDEQHWDYLEKMITLCDNHGVIVLLVTCPTHPFYYSLLDPERHELRKNQAHELEEKYTNVKYIDGLEFPLTQKEMFNPNHLNPAGAEKFTRMLNDTIMSIIK